MCHNSDGLIPRVTLVWEVPCSDPKRSTERSHKIKIWPPMRTLSLKDAYTASVENQFIKCNKKFTSRLVDANNFERISEELQSQSSGIFLL